MQQVIELALTYGFEPDGHTKSEHVRIPTTDNPLFGKSGGVDATLGGRQRFSKTGTSIRATIGKRTTYIYRLESPGRVIGLGSFDTKEVEKIEKLLKEL